MYEQYWGLNEKPFQNTPDPRYLYLSGQHEEALMKLTYVIAQDLGCGMLTGVFGCGKTLIAKVILNDLGQDRVRCAFITNPCFLEPSELLRAIVRGLSPEVTLPEKKTELLADPLLEKLNNILLNNLRDGKQNVVIIDEAHTIEDMHIFEQLRLILNFQSEDRFLLSLIIMGQPELKDKVDASKPLSQRIAVRCNLEPLKEDDVTKYINHRLRIAGRKDIDTNPILSSETIKQIFKHTGGIPRRINTLLDLLLMEGFAKKVSRIEPDLINLVIKDFNFS
ncbi:MAG: AAA family ATPase [Candidatus Omnitrophica bacterium]|nr:AAA family ATPase [Candidatus Omnitrophota bacterium]